MKILKDVGSTALTMVAMGMCVVYLLVCVVMPFFVVVFTPAHGFKYYICLGLVVLYVAYFVCSRRTSQGD